MERKYLRHIFLKLIVCKRIAFLVNGPNLIITVYKFKDADYLKSTLQELSQMSCSDLPHFQFVYSQLQLLLTALTEIFMFWLLNFITFHQLHIECYKSSGSVVLPRVELLKKLLSCSLHDKNLEQLFQKLKPQQRLVNILFDEVKLTETLRYSGGCVVGYTQNDSCDSEVLATHTLVIEVVCHFGGPKYILHI